ncbi:hypothetical protein PV10_01706 [Exophiala mesophila]|uniref:Uncharacterized protein n=1 Tax=Exophiala mesophila TaxID=212818 RepID=A0A0D1ZU14_EXOME|nr:uncharacterized protein PV10_01706 [Exophiala mesophila]KIV98012.1 hypothetical protein PV10_01706 [Exophiala mesophila]
MPNVSFDVFFDKDFINITATRGTTAPKAKPEWKVRTAPKLPPKEKPQEANTTPRPPPRQKLTSTRQSLAPKRQASAPQQVSPDTSDAASQTGEQPRRKPPKLGPRNGVATAGSYTGGAISAVGNSINGIGEGINRSIKRYGDGVLDYGNGVMDWTSATGSRAQTASNPLGLSSGTTQGKRMVTSPQVYRASQPSSNASKALMTTNKTVNSQKKIEGGQTKKALPGPGATSAGKKQVATGSRGAPTTVKKTETKAPVKKPAVGTKSNTPNPGAMRQSNTKPGAGTTRKAAPVKASTASVPKTSIAKPQGKINHTAAANPLGLSY